jgi:hypothetical protein
MCVLGQVLLISYIYLCERNWDRIHGLSVMHFIHINISTYGMDTVNL